MQLELDSGHVHEHEVVSHENGARQVELEDGHRHEQLLELS